MHTSTATAQAILQQPQTIHLGGNDYRVAPPTIGTLIAVSEAVAQLPALDLESDNAATTALRAARHARHIATAIATFILGAKAIREAATRQPCRWLSWLPIGRKSPLESLTQTLLDTTSPQELLEALPLILRGMQVQDFFALTAFLTSVNVTKPTNETTALGHSSQE